MKYGSQYQPRALRGLPPRARSITVMAAPISSMKFAGTRVASVSFAYRKCERGHTSQVSPSVGARSCVDETVGLQMKRRGRCHGQHHPALRLPVDRHGVAKNPGGCRTTRTRHSTHSSSTIPGRSLSRYRTPNGSLQSTAKRKLPRGSRSQTVFTKQRTNLWLSISVMAKTSSGRASAFMTSMSWAFGAALSIGMDA